MAEGIAIIKGDMRKSLKACMYTPCDAEKVLIAPDPYDFESYL